MADSSAGAADASTMQDDACSMAEPQDSSEEEVLSPALKRLNIGERDEEMADQSEPPALQGARAAL